MLTALKAAQTLVTFNGTLFDLRFLRKTFGEVSLPPVHVDLRYLTKRVGLTGGQKLIEGEIGLPARGGFEGMHGSEAVLLWHRYLRGDAHALPRLVAYNRHDVVGMCGILDEMLNRLDVHPDLLFSLPRFSPQGYALLTQPLPLLPGLRSLGRSRTMPTFTKAFDGTPAEHSTVIGIDLTGSEARPSGWCVLRGDRAETAMISSDDEIISRVVTERPAVVSIDSPLSIPFGRVRVEDDDPGRKVWHYAALRTRTQTSWDQCLSMPSS